MLETSEHLVDYLLDPLASLPDELIYNQQIDANLVVFHRPRGQQGNWVEIVKGDVIRVTQKVGKKLKIQISVPTGIIFPDVSREHVSRSLQLQDQTPDSVSNKFTIQGVQQLGDSTIEVLINLHTAVRKAKFTYNFHYELGDVRGESVPFTANFFGGSVSNKRPKPPDSHPEDIVEHISNDSILALPGSLEVNGWVRATSYLQMSDARLKVNVRDITDALQTVSKLKGKRYEWKEEQIPLLGRQRVDVIGLIAQEVRSVIPEVVYEDPETGMLAVSYIELLPVLINAFNEYVSRCDANESSILNEIVQLKNHLNKLSGEIRYDKAQDPFAVERELCVHRVLKHLQSHVTLVVSNSVPITAAEPVNHPILNLRAGFYATMVFGWLGLIPVLYYYRNKSTTAKIGAFLALGDRSVMVWLNLAFFLVFGYYTRTTCGNDLCHFSGLSATEKGLFACVVTLSLFELIVSIYYARKYAIQFRSSYDEFAQWVLQNPFYINRKSENCKKTSYTSVGAGFPILGPLILWCINPKDKYSLTDAWAASTTTLICFFYAFTFFNTSLPYMVILVLYLLLIPCQSYATLLAMEKELHMIVEKAQDRINEPTV